MKLVGTSLLPRVLFLVTLFSATSGVAYLWMQRPEVVQRQSEVSGEVQSSPQPESELAGADSQATPNPSPDPTPAPTTPTESLFSQLSSGINTVAQMVVSGSSSLTYSGGAANSGSINANQLEGSTWDDPAAIGGGTPNSAVFSNISTTGPLSVKGAVTMSQFANGFLLANGIGELSATRVSLSNSSQVADRLPTASGGTGNDFSSTATGSVLSFSATGQMTTVAPATAGYVLTSNGAGALPTWSSPGAASVDWTVPGTIGSATPNSGSFTKLTAAGDSSPLNVGSSGQFKVDNNGRMTIVYTGDSGSLSSSGGVLFLNNTSNIGTGIGIYSNAGAEAQGNMINVKVDNPNYGQAAFYMNYDGNSNAVEIVSNSDDSSSNALAVTGNNINDSTVGIIGYELNRGTIKVSHYRPGSGNDSSASGLSIDLKGSGTRAQGVYVDSTETGGTLGNLLRLRNESVDKFVVNYQGNLTMAGNFTQGASGTDTTFTKQGNNSNDQFFVGTTGAFRVQRSAANSEAFRVQVAGDTQGRWLGTSDGQLKWGPGNATQDVVLKRSTAGVMTLDGVLVMNNSNQALDTVIKGSLDSNLFFVNGSTDRIGIGTSSPVAALHISRDSGTLPSLILNNTGTGDLLTASASGSTKFVVTNAGDVGIGTSSPGYRLTVTGGSTSLASGNWLYFGNAGTLFGNGSSTTLDAPNSGGTLTFNTQGSSRARITSAGLFGIGTNSPAGRLDVQGGNGGNASLIVNQTLSGDIFTASSSGTTRFTIAESGALTALGNITQGANGSNTTFTKLGNTTGDEFFIGTNGAGRFQRSTANSETLRMQVVGDTQGRLVLTSDGRLSWGPGNAAQDAVLRRGTTGVLFLDGAMVMNNSNQALDTVIKGSLDSNLFYVNGSTDRIGMGTSSPVAALHITKNTGTLPSLLLNNTGTGDLLTASASGVSKFTISNAGNVGILTATPGYALDVNGTSNFVGQARFQTSPLFLGSSTSTNFHGDAAQVLGTYRNSSVTDNNWSSLSFQSAGGTLAAGIGAQITNQTNNTANITFGTRGADGFNRRLTILADGNVGIGNTGPSAKLDITSSSTNSDVLRWVASDGSRLGRFTETSGGAGFFEVDNSAGTAVALLRGDGGQSYISTGQFGLGTSSPVAPLHVNGAFGANAAMIVNQVNSGVNIMTASSSGTTRMVMTNDGSTALGGSDPGSNRLKVFGDFEVTGACTGCSSDERLKKNVLQLQGSSLQKLLAIRGVSYEWSDTQRASDYPGLQVGVIAQDVERVYPELVGTDSRGFKFVRYDKLIAPTIEAIREQQGQITTLDGQVKGLATPVTNEFGRVFSWVENRWTTIAEIIFTKSVEFKDQVAFRAQALFTGKVQFEQPLAQSKDAAGSVVLPSAQTSVTVTFAKTYDRAPFVTLTPVGKGVVGYYVDDVTSTGFTVKVEQALSQDVQFNWAATQTSSGAVLGVSASSPQPSVSPSPTPQSSPQVSPSPSVLPSPSPTVMPSPSPEVSAIEPASPSASQASQP